MGRDSINSTNGALGLSESKYGIDFVARNQKPVGLLALGRAAERRPTGKRLRRRKMLGIVPRAASPASGARVGRQLYAYQHDG